MIISNWLKFEISWQLVDKFLILCVIEDWVQLLLKISYSRSTNGTNYFPDTYFLFPTIIEQQIRKFQFQKISRCQ